MIIFFILSQNPLSPKNISRKWATESNKCGNENTIDQLLLEKFEYFGA
jgi:hypothetical protein